MVETSQNDSGERNIIPATTRVGRPLGASSSPPFVGLSRFTTRQKRVLMCLSRGRTVQQAADELGMSRQRIYQIIELTRGRIAELMDDSGLTDAALIEQYLKPALNATETEFAKFGGAITDRVETVAWGPRLQALELAGKWRGLGQEKAAVVNVGIAVSVDHNDTEE